VPPNVYGDLGIEIVLYNEDAVMPQLPFDVTLIIRPVEGDGEIRYKMADPNGSFALTLSPGRYRLTGLEVESPSVQADPFDLYITDPTSPDPVSLRFTVPAQGCAYVGLIHLTYYRFPGLPIIEQMNLIAEWSREVRRNIFFSIVESGALVPYATIVQLPGEGDRATGSAGCTVQPAAFEKL
jgi:hypothetical protein